MTKRKHDLLSVIEEAPQIPSVCGSGEAVNQSATGASNREVHQAYVAGEVANKMANWTQGHEGQLASLGGDTETLSPLLENRDQNNRNSTDFCCFK